MSSIEVMLSVSFLLIKCMCNAIEHIIQLIVILITICVTKVVFTSLMLLFFD